ncbi:sugar MFS transporter [Hephaestia sp. GCM10023244]|uniref:sugar MFS transporter n=1 Tax=unclassified Hephaestia TaxID=2631281 RepID=UPI002077884E|nr:sugar MFS transporter [Hephaestia sp. MAHUQ-44]MCM8730594.1 sugar MFS transporter [Hephaestia sp. MAHUQ-44]
MSTHHKATGAFASVTTLFFAWGFITSLVDPLVAAVKGIFSLSNVEAQLSAFAFFIAYGVISIPAAILVSRLRAVPSIVLAIAMMIAGCFVILVGTNLDTYPGVLLGLFVIASGITVLQVAANPLAAALGVPERSHFRLTLSQAFNSLGTVLGPLLGANLLLKGVEVKPGDVIEATARSNALGAIDLSFIIIAVLLAFLAGFIWWSRHRITSAAPPAPAAHGFRQTLTEVAGARWALIGGLAIFLYVGAEVAIGTQMALFLNSEAIWNIPLQHAGYYVSLYWLGAMIGRFIGSALLTRIKAHRLLAINTAIAAALCLFVVLTRGVPAGYAALSIGLFNSVMFPVIFTLTLERSSASTSATSGFLCMAIIGGAIIPLIVGKIADISGYSAGLIVPMICYAVLCLIAIGAGRAATHAAGVDSDEEFASPH